MKNKNRIKKGVLFGTLLLIASLLLVTGCDNPVASGYKNIPDGQGTVTLILGGSGRTIMPVFDADADITTYELTFTPSGGSALPVIIIDVTEIDDFDPVTKIIRPIKLDVGLYTLKVDAKVGSNIVATKTTALDGVEVVAKNDTPVAIELEMIYDGVGTGTFSWDIDISDILTTFGITNVEYFASATMTIEGATPPTITFVDDTNRDPLTNKYKLDDEIDLPSGQYTVTIKFVDGTNGDFVWEEILYVYGGLTSELNETFTIAFFRVPSVDEVLEEILGYDEDNWVAPGEKVKLAPEYAWEQGVDIYDPSYDPNDSDTWIPVPAGNLFYIYSKLSNAELTFTIPAGWKFKKFQTSGLPSPHLDIETNVSATGLSGGETGLVTVTNLAAALNTHVILEYDGAVEGGSLEYRLVLAPTAQYYVVGASASQQIEIAGLTFPRLDGKTAFVEDPCKYSTVTITVADTLGVSVVSGTGATPTISPAPGAGNTTVYTLTNNSDIYTVTVYEKEDSADVVNDVRALNEDNWITDPESLASISESYSIDKTTNDTNLWTALYYIASKLPTDNTIKLTLPDGWEYDGQGTRVVTGSSPTASLARIDDTLNGFILVELDPTYTYDTVFRLSYTREVSSGIAPAYFELTLSPVADFRTNATIATPISIDGGALPSGSGKTYCITDVRPPSTIDIIVDEDSIITVLDEEGNDILDGISPSTAGGQDTYNVSITSQVYNVFITAP